jgi:hypothetical protein
MTRRLVEDAKSGSFSTGFNTFLASRLILYGFHSDVGIGYVFLVEACSQVIHIMYNYK